MPIQRGGSKKLKTQKFGSKPKPKAAPKPKQEKKPAKKAEPKSRREKKADKLQKQAQQIREKAIKKTDSGTKERYSADRKANRKDLRQEKKRLKDKGVWDREQRKDNKGRKKEGKARGLRERAEKATGTKQNRLSRRAARKEAAAKKKDLKAAYGKGKTARKAAAAERKLSRAAELRKKAEKASGRKKRRLLRRAKRKERKAQKKYRQAGVTREQAMNKAWESKQNLQKERDENVAKDKQARVGYGWKTGVKDEKGGSKDFYMSRGGDYEAHKKQNQEVFNKDRQSAWDKTQRERLARGENLWKSKTEGALEGTAKEIEQSIKPKQDYFSSGGGYNNSIPTADRSDMWSNAASMWGKKRG